MAMEQKQISRLLGHCCYVRCFPISMCFVESFSFFRVAKRFAQFIFQNLIGNRSCLSVNKICLTKALEHFSFRTAFALASCGVRTKVRNANLCGSCETTPFDAIRVIQSLNSRWVYTGLNGHLHVAFAFCALRHGFFILLFCGNPG